MLNQLLAMHPKRFAGRSDECNEPGARLSRYEHRTLEWRKRRRSLDIGKRRFDDELRRTRLIHTEDTARLRVEDVMQSFRHKRQNGASVVGDDDLQPFQRLNNDANPIQ